MYSLLSFIGILIGILIAKYTKEELKQGKKYFLWIERASLILILLVIAFNFKLSWLVLIGLMAGYFIPVQYLAFGLILTSFENIIIACLIFIYGLPYGSLINKDKTKRVLKELILFIIPALLLINNFGLMYQKELISVAAGILLIRGVNWSFKK
ncbi:hypothetical protein J4427_03080 [Candidatus Woesearchaeota archaeon]|nr:hypothetical protein [Candidatus Woesearchaeota archaeon]